MASETTDRLKTVGKVAKKWKVGDPIDALTQAGNIPTWNTVRQRFWKNMGKALKDVLDEDTLKRLNKGLAPLDEYRESIHLHHPNGREGAEEFFTFGPVRKIDHMDWHKKNGYRF